jgi:hypothetical protein
MHLKPAGCYRKALLLDDIRCAREKGSFHEFHYRPKADTAPYEHPGNGPQDTLYRSHELRSALLGVGTP